MTFVPQQEIKYFQFKLSGSDEVFQLPLRQYLAIEFAERFTDAAMELKDFAQAYKAGSVNESVIPDVDQIRALTSLQRELFDTYAPGAYAAGTQFEINQVMAEWGRQSDITMGESQASFGF